MKHKKKPDAYFQFNHASGSGFSIKKMSTAPGEFYLRIAIAIALMMMAMIVTFS